MLTLVLVAAVGVADFLAGFELSLLVFYILPVCLAVTVSRTFSVATAVACVAIWLWGDIAAGAHFASYATPVANAFGALATYLIVIWMFSRVLALQRDMEQRVRQRTAALTEMIAERERLEKAILDVSERERRSIGYDLHDGLGQHLTGTALAGEVLADKLRAKGAPEEADVSQIVNLIEEGIEKSRCLARGLLLSEIQRNGLVAALQELAADVAAQFGITCEFSSTAPEIAFVDGDCATHLFRIAHEAARNAVRHGRTKRITISLAVDESVRLAIRDFGIGLHEPTARGLGLSIMAHRAEIIGGRFSIAPHASGGTLVTCELPLSSLRHA